VQGVDGLYCLLTERIDDELLDAAGPQLRVVSTMSVGYDHVDVDACRRRGIPLGNTPGVLTDTTADLTLALMLATARRLIEAAAAVKSGEWSSWKPEWMTGYDLFGSTVGIIGLGRIGVAVAERLRGFGCRLLYTGSAPKPAAEPLGAQFTSLEQLLAESDFVTVHAPLNAATHHLINADTLRQMKRTAILINTSRGGTVDQEALYQALVQGQIAASGLDVTTPEPLPTDHPLLTLPNCVVLPHIGSASIATRTKMALMAAENVIAGVLGQPLPNAV
jgi:glyoxylate/hydroxypyruvate reductase